MERLFDGPPTVGRSDVVPRSDLPVLRLFRSGSSSWVPELDADFLGSRARQTIKCWMCFICHSSHEHSSELGAHLDQTHRQMTCLFAMNPRLFPRCLVCGKFFPFSFCSSIVWSWPLMFVHDGFFRLPICVSGRPDASPYRVSHRQHRVQLDEVLSPAFSRRTFRSVAFVIPLIAM